MKKIYKRIGISIVVGILILVGIFLFYVQDYSPAEPSVRQLIAQTETIKVENNKIVLYPQKENEDKIGFIFYPGGKVEYDAYVPLLERLSKEGILVVLYKMPFNLAVFDINAAKTAFEEFPEVNRWYIGGHSLGGAMASDFANKNKEKLQGLVLLGAYPVKKIDFPILTIVGSEDGVINRKKLEGLNITEIEGGNHAYFGNYGPQNGDGKATISREKQQQITVKQIIQFFFK